MGADPKWTIGARGAGRLRRLRARLRDERGAAAVEFALILPLMLGLYVSTVVTTKAYMATRKVALVARALADVASRQTAASGNPTVSDTDMTNFFSAARTIMAPYSTTSLKMTLSRVDVMKDSSNNLWAFTKWSVTNGTGASARPCNGQNPGFTPSGSSTLSTTNQPLKAGDKSLTDSTYPSFLAPEYTTTGAPTGYLIVADVVYTYSPGFTFKVFNWGNITSINTGWSQAFWSRTGLPIVGTSLSTNATKCPTNDPGVS